MTSRSKSARASRAVAAGLFAIALAGISDARAQDPNAVGSVSGRVTDEAGDPQAGLVIRFLPLHDPEAPRQEVETDRKGRFLVGFFPVGVWRPEVAAEDRFLRSLDVRGGSKKTDETDASQAYFEVRFKDRVKLGIVVARSERGRREEGQAPDVALPEDEGTDAGLLAKPLEMLRLGDMEGVLATIEPVLEIDPDQPTAHYLKGVALWRLGRGEESLAHLRRAVELLPDQPGVHGALGTALIDAGDARRQAGHDDAARPLFEEAVLHLRAEIEIMDDPAPVLSNLGSVLMRLERNEEAIEVLRRVADQQPSDARVQVSLADLLTKVGRNEEAVAVLERVDVNSEAVAAVIFNAAAGMYNAGSFDSAILILEKSARDMPESFLLHKALARNYLAVGRQEDAVRELKESLRLAPEGADTELERELLSRFESE